MLRLLPLLLLLLACPALAKPPLMLAAASLQESMTAAADAWAARGHERPVLSFASSSALARQIVAGAPADLFASADEAWMDEVAAHRLLRPGTRANLVTNRLVLIAPAAVRGAVAIRPDFPLARIVGNRRLAMADPDSVPAGRYGRDALTRLGAWDGVKARLALADNVRGALALVERGEAAFGIVYATDALASTRVRVVGMFPSGSHARIAYPLATLAAAQSADAEPFRRFLLSDAGRAIFRRFGFGTR